MGRSDHRHTDAQYADLADLILALARAISTEVHSDPQIVDLTSTEVNVMRFVGRHPGALPSAVAASTGLQRSNLSRTLRDLVDKGMIEKTTTAADGRQVQLHSTRRAEANLKRLRATWSRVLAGAGADASNLAASLTMLTQLEAGLNARAGCGAPVGSAV
jgi:DNA-binding MarR family transcriptional regulator